MSTDEHRSKGPCTRGVINAFAGLPVKRLMGSLFSTPGSYGIRPCGSMTKLPSPGGEIERSHLQPPNLEGGRVCRWGSAVGFAQLKAFAVTYHEKQE